MTTNSYFTLYGKTGQNANERKLINDLTIESIQMWGMDINYIPRSLVKEDSLFQEDTISAFNSFYTIEAYIENVEGFDGDVTMSKFGLFVTDEVSFYISQQRFLEVVGKVPAEGDLIHLPMAKKKATWEILFVEDEDQFYPLGTLPAFKVKCQLYNLSAGETVSTGIPALDDKASELETLDPFADNATIETEADATLDFTETNPWGTY